jgi:hypothetical protein
METASLSAPSVFAGDRAMLARSCNPTASRRADEKIRPASHSYLVQREPFALAIIGGLCAVLIYAGVWLVRLLG